LKKNHPGYRVFTESEKDWTKVLGNRPNVESFLDRQTNLNQRRLNQQYLQNFNKRKDYSNAQDRRLRSLDASKYIQQRNNELFRSREKGLNLRTEFLPHLKLRFKKRVFNRGKIEMVGGKTPGIGTPDPNIDITNFIETNLPESPEPALVGDFAKRIQRIGTIKISDTAKNPEPK
jgi:hypothetical protein